MKVKYSRFRHNAKQTSFTSPTGPRRQGGEHEHAQYPTNDDVTSGWSCRRPENVSILSSLMLSGEGNAGKWWKTTIGLISKKKNSFARAAHLFWRFLCPYFAQLQRETSRNFLVTRFMEEMSYVFSFTFFLLSLIFTLHWWPLAFPILSLPPATKFSCWSSSKKMSLLFFISCSRPCCRPSSRWVSLAYRLLSLFLCLSISCSIFQICGHDN